MNQPLHFVIIEDDVHSADAMRLLLEHAGHRVQVCLDSTSALDFVAAAQPDVALIDIMMPVMDGIEVCRRLHSMPKLEAMKSVIVTGKAYENDRLRALEAGARGVVLKPFNPQTFVADILAFVSEEVALSYWGVRGSLPVSGPKALRYGGNTSCVALELPQEQLFIFDAGTGIKALAEHAVEASDPIRSAKIFISHPHWDHINGLPFFTPLFQRGNEFEILGPSQGKVSMRELIAVQFAPLYSAVTVRDFAARVFFRDLSEMSFDVGEARIRTLLLPYPGNCLGYRVDYKDSSVCYIPDAELPTKDSPTYNADFEAHLLRFLGDADVAMIQASQHGEQTEGTTSPRFQASVTRVAEIAHEAGVGQLQLFHHNPDEDDDAIDRKVAHARKVLKSLGSRVTCEAPREGSRLKLSDLPTGRDGANPLNLSKAA